MARQHSDVARAGAQSPAVDHDPFGLTGIAEPLTAIDALTRTSACLRAMRALWHGSNGDAAALLELAARELEVVGDALARGMDGGALQWPSVVLAQDLAERAQTGAA